MGEDRKPRVIRDMRVTGVSLIPVEKSVFKNPPMLVTVKVADDEDMERLKNAPGVSIRGTGIAVRKIPWWKKVLKWLGLGLGAILFVFAVSARVIFGRRKKDVDR